MTATKRQDENAVEVLDWVKGDNLGLDIPAHGEALRAGGTRFLTQAFRAAGAIGEDNRVSRIRLLKECPGGSTGRKLLLTVNYKTPSPDLPTKLFVKFSRDFDDPIRDRAKNQLEAEVRLGLLSRTPSFPIKAPACLFADYNHETGTGLLITERVPFGKNGVEPPHEKCLDYLIADPLAHYRVIVAALARLSGSHKAGKLDACVETYFPFDAEAEIKADPIRYDARQIGNRIARYGEFAAQYPQYLPDNIREPAFIEQLAREAPRFLEHQAAIKSFLYSKPDFIALCHWNANIDNAFFWRDEAGQLHCGLMDWGRVGQMSVAMSLWGALSAAETDFWNAHLDDLLALYVAEFRAVGGPKLDAEEIKQHMMLFIALLGLAWLLDAPALMKRQFEDFDALSGPRDPRFAASETARAQRVMLSNVLNLWRTQDFGARLDRMLAAR